MKYDKEHIDIIINQLNEGNGRVAACKAAGISYHTFLSWMEDPEKVQFLQSVKKAEAEGENRIEDLAVRAILSKFSTQWQSAAWWLERKLPEKYRNRAEVMAKISQEQTDAILKAFDVEDEEIQEPEP